MRKSFIIIMENKSTKEIEKLKEFAEHVTLEIMHKMLSEIGLTLDLNENNYAHYYYNNSNEFHYFQMITSPLDKKHISAYNTNGEFYNLHMKGFKSKLGNKLNEIRNEYFTTIKKKGIEYIISF